jgi:hypothetical protein
MPFVVKQDAKVDWLAQFQPQDSPLAERLVDGIRFVSHSELASSLRESLLELVAESKKTVALFTEREQRRPGGTIERLYKQAAKRPRKAHGAALRPVDPKLAYDPKVGSEGIIAQLLSELSKENSTILFHPTIEKCIEREVRRFVLTDIIGSGKRASDWLDSAWQTSTLRSWHSYGLLRFEIVAFAATAKGRRLAEGHASRPRVRNCLSCPTIGSKFRKDEAKAIRDLCIRYDPIDQDPVESLGFAGGEVLIAFEHSIPNNSPRLLTKGSRYWQPLFHRHVTRGRFEEANNGRLVSARALEKLRHSRLAKAVASGYMLEVTRKWILFLAASSSGPRTQEALSRKSGLLLSEVGSLIKMAKRIGWIDSEGRLTESGHKQLVHAKDMFKTAPKPRLQGSGAPYYPQSLRVPRNPI